MSNTNRNPIIFLIGVVFILLSLVLFLVPEWGNMRKFDSFFELVAGNYLLFLAYLIILFINGLINWNKEKTKTPILYTPILLILFSISAFTLNLEIPIFKESALWLKIYLVFAHLSLFACCFIEFSNPRLKNILMVCLGVSFVLFFYFTIYLAPYYPVGLMLFLALGISLHIYVPLLISIFLIIIITKHTEKNSLIYVLSGAIIPILVSIYFTIQWSKTSSTISMEYNQAIANEDNELPAWVRVSQKISDNWISKRLLGTDIIYDKPRESFQFFNVPRKNFDDPVHDPLVMTSSLFHKNSDLTIEEKYKILESTYDHRHEGERRLWSGEDLKTENVTTKVKIYPEYRISYTEKVLSIKSIPNQQRWGNGQQEAIYTFYLPEGSVVTSLSLWIDGKEEKALLTTKAKADSAYQTIVGVERRDPSVVTWQEGGSVSVRVFPCTEQENRRFRIGVTSPLQKDHDLLIYQNISFKGPESDDTNETIEVQFEQTPQEVILPSSFDKEEEKKYSYNGSYKSFWEISFKAPAVSNSSFSFNGESYKMEEYVKEFRNFNPEKIYLDINNTWTRSEFNQLLEIFSDKKIYVYDDQTQKLSDENKYSLFDKLSEYNYSLFPIYEIHNPENSLLITKESHLAPFLKDLNGSLFASKTKEFLQRNKKVQLFCLGNDLPPYLRTLKEFRTFNYDHGNIDDLKQLIKDKKFIKNSENESTIVLENSDLKILKSANNNQSSAPDHLLRLFTYNNILKEIGKNYFDENYINEDIIKQASTAYVVSPVSSLIVLETQNDYDRFGIEETNNSLKNASMKSSGAVPEPHEWALIAILILILLYLKYRPNFKFNIR